MKPKDIIRSPKVATEAGSWKVITGKAKMAATAFPLSRNFSVQLGRNWHWRVDVVHAKGVDYRLLTAFHPETEEYRAWLAAPRGASHVMVGQLEYHGTHPGWHCHVACCDLDEVENGQAHPRSAVRFPNGNSKHRRTVFGMSESDALSTAFNFFRVTGMPKGDLL